MRRRLLILKSLIKGQPCEMITKSDAEYVTVRDGHKVRNLAEVLSTISKELNSLNTFKRSFGLTKKDHEAMDHLKNMLEYMEDKENSSDIMNYLKKSDDEVKEFESVQETFRESLTNLAKALTILQEELNQKGENNEGNNSETKVPDDVSNPEDPNESGNSESGSNSGDDETDENKGEDGSDVGINREPNNDPLTGPSDENEETPLVLPTDEIDEGEV